MGMVGQSPPVLPLQVQLNSIPGRFSACTHACPSMLHSIHGRGRTSRRTRVHAQAHVPPPPKHAILEPACLPHTCISMHPCHALCCIYWARGAVGDPEQFCLPRGAPRRALLMHCPRLAPGGLPAHTYVRAG